MNVPIKFRGRDENTGEFVYGDLCQTLSTPSIVNCEGRFFVKPDSVAQLVGYGKDGREVYEGDIMVDERGTEWKAGRYSSCTLAKENIDDDGLINYSMEFVRRGK